MRFINSLTLLFSWLMLIATPATRADWSNALKPKGAPGDEIVLVEAGRPLRPIVLSKSATTIEKNAAADLQNWIEQITTGRPEIIDSDSGPAIHLMTDAALGEEGYRVALEGDDLILAGGTKRGVMNAVYALLEEDLGCRFYTKDSIRLPKVATLSVRPVARTFIPKLSLRDPFYQVAFDGTWSLRNRTNSPSAPVSEDRGGYIDYGGLLVHTAAQLLPADKYFKDHPEYFALNSAGQRYSAQLCPTDPEVAKIVTASILDTLRQHPETEIVSVSKNDNPGDQICHCERCKKVREAEGSDSGCQLVLVNAVAEAIEKAYPRVVVDTLAYLETVQPPKTIRPRHNVAIRLCNDVVGAWSHPFTSARHCAVAETITNWSKIQDRIYIWDYNVNFSHYLAPMPNIDIMADNVRFWIDNHAQGVMLQGGYQGPADGDEMKAWVMSKILWDSSRDEKALVQDFIWGHYGAAAPALAEYEALLNDLRKTYAAEMASPAGGIRYSMDASFYAKDFVEKAEAVFARAVQLAGDDAELLRRVERAKLPVLYVKCWRGPKFAGASYADSVADFERIARQENVQYLVEGAPTIDKVLTIWKERIPKPTTTQQ